MKETKWNSVRTLDGVIQTPAFGMGKDGRQVYEDTAQAATRGGFLLPSGETDWEALYPGKPWASWAKVRLSCNRYNYVFPNGDVLLKSTIRRVAGLHEPREHEWLKKMFTLPNSQVKNFLNACRGSYGNFKTETSVLVIGSKAREGTGLWTKLFALYCLSYSKKTYIDFIDPAERPSYWEYEMDGRSVSCSWIVGMVTPEMTVDYDIVIDDSWLAGVSSIGYDIKAGSIKGQGPLFLHPKEGRLFKSGQSSYQSPCECLLCQEIGRCVESYEQYQVMRLYCSRLGHEAPCSSAFYSSEVTIVSQFIKQLLTTGAVPMKTNTMIRGLLSVMEDIPVEVDKGVVTMGSGHAQFRDISRFDITVIDRPACAAPHLNGKKVIFVGVNPTVLQGVLLKRTKDSAMHAEQGVDVIFVQSRRLWAQVMSTPYCPDTIYAPDQLDFSFPGWRKTGKRVADYYEFYRQPVLKERKWEVGQLCNGEIYPAVPFTPFLDVSQLGMPLQAGVVRGSVTYWRIQNFSLVHVKDPTFEKDHVGMLAVDLMGHWRVALKGNTGSIPFGEGSYAYLHPENMLPEEDHNLLTLIKRSQNGYITDKEMQRVMKGVGELLTVQVGVKRSNKILVRYLFSDRLPPKFLLTALTSLKKHPLMRIEEEGDLDQLRSAWARRVALEAATFVDIEHGKKSTGGQRVQVKILQ